MSISTTKGMLYLTAMDSLERLDIQFVPKLNTNTQASIADVQVIGRNNPLHHWSGANKSVRLELDFHAEEESREDVIRKVRWLESMALTEGTAFAQERVRLTWGRLFKPDELFYVKGVSVDLQMFDPLNGMLPRQAYVSLDLVLSPTRNLTKAEVRW